MSVRDRCTLRSILLVIILAPVTAQIVCSQSYTLIGSVVDSSDVALSRATVLVLSQTDSTLIQFGTSRSDGTFAIRQLKSGAYILQISHIGMQMALLDFTVQSNDVDVGRVVMSSQTQVIEEFIVTSKRVPYVIRGDTLEFNAMAFSVRPQDMVEDMLRQLPGIQVSPSGRVSVHGKAISHILVEGSLFQNLLGTGANLANFSA